MSQCSHSFDVVHQTFDVLQLQALLVQRHHDQSELIRQRPPGTVGVHATDGAIDARCNLLA